LWKKQNRVIMNFPLFTAVAVSRQGQQPLFQGHTQIFVNEDNSLCECDIRKDILLYVETSQFEHLMEEKENVYLTRTLHQSL